MRPSETELSRDRLCVPLLPSVPAVGFGRPSTVDPTPPRSISRFHAIFFSFCSRTRKKSWWGAECRVISFSATFTTNGTEERRRDVPFSLLSLSSLLVASRRRRSIGLADELTSERLPPAKLDERQQSLRRQRHGLELACCRAAARRRSKWKKILLWFSFIYPSVSRRRGSMPARRRWQRW